MQTTQSSLYRITINPTTTLTTTMALNIFHPFAWSSDFDDDMFRTPFLVSNELLVPARRGEEDTTPNSSMMIIPWTTRAFSHHHHHHHPGYEIHEDEKSYAISIDIPGVQADEMTLKLEDDGRVLHLSGGRKVVQKEGSVVVSETKFIKRFTLGENVDTEKLTANLENGVLRVTAPKKVVEAPVMTTEIPIVQGGAAAIVDMTMGEDEKTEKV
jgi:HSP20 family protein